MPGRKTTRRVALVALILSMATLGAGPAGAYHGDQLSDTRSRLRAARTRLSKLVNSDRQLAAVVASLGAELSATRARLAEARATLLRIESGIRREERRLDRLRRLNNQKSQAIEGRVRQMYILGPGFRMESLFAAGNYQDFIARSTVLDYLNRFDRVVMEDLAKIRYDTKVSRELLIRDRLRASRVRDGIAERESIQSEIYAAKHDAEAKLDARIDQQRNEIRSLEREQSRIQAIIASFGSRGSVATGAVSRRGFVWPIRGQITSDYGPRWGSFHTGIDIDCETGEGIGASKKGSVIAAGWQGGYGNAVIVDHGGGVATLYAHMSALYVGDGQQVSQRQRVGACGSTGNSTGDHLHFEVRINGDHTDPKPFLP